MNTILDPRAQADADRRTRAGRLLSGLALALAAWLAFCAWLFLTRCATAKPDLCGNARAALAEYQTLAADPNWQPKPAEIRGAQIAAAVVSVYCWDVPATNATRTARTATAPPRQFDRFGVLIVPP